MAIAPQSYTVNGDAPTPIYPYGFQAALTLTNRGTITVYVSNAPALSGGYAIEAGRSIGWESGRALYAYTGGGESTLQAVEGEVTGQGTIAVSSIATPVLVQGGGEFLVSGLAAVPLGSWVDIDIPAPASGLRFPSMEVFVQRPVSNTSAIFWQLFSQDSAGNYIDIASGVVYSNPSSASYKFFGFTAFQERVLVPFTGNYPAKLRLTNLTSGSGTHDVVYQVTGGQRETPVPITDTAALCLAPRLALAAGASYTVLLPPSHTPYIVDIFDTGAPSAGASSYYDTGSLTFVTRTARPVYYPFQYSTNQHYRYVHPGHGMPEQLDYTVSAGSGAFLSLQPIQ